jgi:RecQ family ATP-dependent DNA helicase
MGPAPSEILAGRLEPFLCPGKRLRLSPLVEAVQSALLFGETPRPERHAQGLGRIARGNRARLVTFAERFLAEDGGVCFSRAFYKDASSLDFYVAHYLPANVGKLQIVLLDLLRAGKLPETLRVLDLGVGPGTTFVAVTDFLLALASICDLEGLPLPVRDFSLRGLESSPECREYALRAARSMRTLLAGRAPGVREPPDRNGTMAPGPALATAVALSLEALAGATVRPVDLISAGADVSGDATCIVASNVLNEIWNGAADGLSALAAGLREGLLIVIEPGDRQSSQRLMGWRRAVVAGTHHLRSVLPCGQEFGPALPEQCLHCWCARREHLHLGPIQRAFHLACEELAAELGWNRERKTRALAGRMSWSYTVLAAGGDQGLLLENRAARNGSLDLRFIGCHLVGRVRREELLPETDDPPDAARGRRMFSFCPATYTRSNPRTLAVCLTHEPGKVLAPLRFGQVARLEQVRVTAHESWTELSLSRNSRVTALNPSGADVPQRACHTASPAALDALAFRLFGFPALRPFQHAIIRRTLAGKSTLGIAATGAGKTECYLLPALLLPGATIVISPLKSLMQDQVERCSDRYGLEDITTCINGEVKFRERLVRLAKLRAGRYKLVYLTPEQLGQTYVLETLTRSRVSLLAIDEAHCVSQWGHEFRPSYLNMLRRLRERLSPFPPVVALTATASERVRRDLCHPSMLDLINRPVEDGGDIAFYRSNRKELDLVVRVHASHQDRSRWIVRDLEPFARQSVEGSAIVFMPLTGATRYAGENRECSAGVEPFATYLEEELQTKVAIYHSKMDDERQDVDPHDAREEVHGHTSGRARAAEQRAFMQNERAIMVATKGFGMGIDKEDIRLVIHRSLPGDLLAYAQEAGRAGRDGRQSRAVLCYTERDRKATRNEAGPLTAFEPVDDRAIQERFIQQRYVRAEDIRLCLSFLCQCPRRRAVPTHSGTRTYLLFSFNEVEQFAERLVHAGDYRWPSREQLWFDDEREDHFVRILKRGADYQFRKGVIKCCLETLFKIHVPILGAEHSLLTTCQEVQTALRTPPRLNWRAIEDTNDQFLNGALTRASLGGDGADLERLLHTAVTQDLIPLAERLGLTVAETVQLLRYAWSLEVIDRLTFTTRSWCGVDPDGSEWLEHAGAWRYLGKKGAPLDQRFPRRFWSAPVTWEVGLAAPLDDEALVERVMSIVSASHAGRREEDQHDFSLLVNEYINGTRCLRKVLLAFLRTGEDVREEGCGACSRCRPGGDFLPVEERESRIQLIPVQVWPRLQEIARSTDTLPPLEVLQGLCSYLASPQGEASRDTVYLNAEAMLREDPGSLGAAALLLCVVAHGWVTRDNEEIERLLGLLLRARQAEPRGLAALLALAGEAGSGTAPLCYWRAQLAHEFSPETSAGLWRDFLACRGASRERVHEAAAALAADEPHYALLMARTSRRLEDGVRFYAQGLFGSGKRAEGLGEEARALFQAPGTSAEHARTLVALLLAGIREGAGVDYAASLLRSFWTSIRGCLGSEEMLVLLEACGDGLTDEGWPEALAGLLAPGRSVQFEFAILRTLSAARDLRRALAAREAETVAAAIARCARTQDRPSWAAPLVRWVISFLPERVADVNRGILRWASPEDACYLARVGPLLAASWLKDGEPALPLRPEVIDHLLEYAKKAGDTNLAARLFRSAVARGGDTLPALLLLLRRGDEALPAGFRVVAGTALELANAHRLLRSGRLFHLSDAPGTFDLQAASASCPVRMAAYIAWLVYLCRHPRTSELFKIDLRAWLFQALVRAGWHARAEKLAPRFAFMRIGPERVCPGAYLERTRAASQRADPMLMLTFLRLLRAHRPGAQGAESINLE